MKNILSKYTKVLIRPIVYRSFTWGIFALTAALLWERFVGPKSFLSVKKDIFFIVGIFFFALAWYYYLKVDGVRPPKINIEKPKQRKKHWGYGDIIDFADEHVVTFDELDDEEQDLCKLATNAILGGVYLLMSFFFA